MPYCVLKHAIHAGSYGEVFAGTLNSTTRNTSHPVAIKRIKQSLQHCSDAYAEIAILDKLKGQFMHPHYANVGAQHLVTYLMHYDMHDHLHIVFEFMPSNLANALASESFEHELVRAERNKKYMRDLLAGLMFCHAKQIVHRDLKPENLLVTHDQLKIADFGISKQLYLDVDTHDDITKDSFDAEQTSFTTTTPGGTRRSRKNSRQELLTSGMVTLWYRSPELLVGGKWENAFVSDYSYSTDLWSVGCIAAELLFAIRSERTRNARAILRFDMHVPNVAHATVLFKGNGQTDAEQNLNQMDKIARVLGTPTTATWPSLTQHKTCPAPFMSIKGQKKQDCMRMLICHLDVMEKNDPYRPFFHVITKTLMYEPRHRATARALYYQLFH